MDFSASSTVIDTSLPQVKQATVDLTKAAGTYDLVTATNGGVYIDLYKLAMYVSVVGATLTSVSIQTNQAHATTILSSTEGAVANLTVGKNLVRAIPVIGSLYLASGEKLQYTIAGSTGTGAIIVTIPYMPAVASARLT